MSLAAEYRQQRAWRPWPSIFAALPSLSGQTILDLGCGVGDQAAEMVARGARVIGVDTNEELLREARSRELTGAEFHLADLRSFTGDGLEVDGLWCSFATAYFPALHAPLESWASCLRPGGWAAFTEIDDFFGHRPLGARTSELFEAYARDALATGRYDFHMGRKLRDHLEQAGFVVAQESTLDDQELSFDGPARPEVVDAWRHRLDRMTLLRAFCGAEYERIRAEFLAALTRDDHVSTAKVYCCIGLG